MDFRKIITIGPDKRGGRACIRGMRITVYDVLGWLAAGMSTSDIILEFPELTIEDIRTALAFAADREPLRAPGQLFRLPELQTAF